MFEYIDELTLKTVLKNKFDSDDNIEPYCITPEINDYIWTSNIKGTKHNKTGIPIECYGDTKDKIVLTPAHLGAPFTYWFERKKCNDVFWDKKCLINVIDKYNEKLLNIGYELVEKGYIVWLCNIHDLGKGNITSLLYDLTKTKLSYNDFQLDSVDCVLFVFISNLHTLKNLMCD
jgi:hypothetical protein